MIIVLQRVSQASVTIDNLVHSSIEKGFVALVGFQPDDNDEDLAFMVRKITNIRIFGEKGIWSKAFLISMEIFCSSLTLHLQPIQQAIDRFFNCNASTYCQANV